MDIAGDGGRVITTWDGLVHWGVTGLIGSGITGNGNGCVPIDSGGVALGKMAGDLVVCLATGSSLKDTSSGPGKEG